MVHLFSFTLKLTLYLILFWWFYFSTKKFLQNRINTYQLLTVTFINLAEAAMTENLNILQN